MPARLSSMELSDPLTPDPSGATNRRKSTRTRQKPVLLHEDFSTTSGNNKRKRTELHSNASGDNQDNILDDESSLEESDGDPDQEEVKERKRRAPRPKKPQTKPTVKKAKTNNTVTTKLAVRPAMNGTKKASKPKKPPIRSVGDASDDGTGLYGIFVRAMIISYKANSVSSRSIFSRAHSGCCCCRLDDALRTTPGQCGLRFDQLCSKVYRM